MFFRTLDFKIKLNGKWLNYKKKEQHWNVQQFSSAVKIMKLFLIKVKSLECKLLSILYVINLTNFNCKNGYYLFYCQCFLSTYIISINVYQQQQIKKEKKKETN